MNILPIDHSQGSVLAYSHPVKKARFAEPVVNFISPLDALPLNGNYVTVQLVDVPIYKLAYFTHDVFYGIDDQCPYHPKNIICWKACLNEGFNAIA